MLFSSVSYPTMTMVWLTYLFLQSCQRYIPTLIHHKISLNFGIIYLPYDFQPSILIGRRLPFVLCILSLVKGPCTFLSSLP